MELSDVKLVRTPFFHYVATAGSSSNLARLIVDRLPARHVHSEKFQKISQQLDEFKVSVDSSFPIEVNLLDNTTQVKIFL